MPDVSATARSWPLAPCIGLSALSKHFEPKAYALPSPGVRFMHLTPHGGLRCWQTDDADSQSAASMLLMTKSAKSTNAQLFLHVSRQCFTGHRCKIEAAAQTCRHHRMQSLAIQAVPHNWAAARGACAGITGPTSQIVHPCVIARLGSCSRPPGRPE